MTVRSAVTAAPATTPVEASTPEGTSTETTGTPSSRIWPMWAAASRRATPENPVPKIASTTTSGAEAASTNGTPALRARESISAASPWIFSSGPARTTSAWRPALRTSRAITNPSPPFAPAPHQTVNCFASGKRASTSSAVAAPARSMRSSVGPAYAASAARISSAV